MKIKPHIHNGRFYNNADDSIVTRVANTIKTIGLIAWARLTFRGSKKKLIGKADVASWNVSPNLAPVSQELVITWLGHATFLIQVGGFNILTDPLFFELSFFAQRFIKAPLTPDQLPHIDAVIISHNHADHVDEKSLAALKQFQPAMHVPLGNKEWFTARGFTNVVEMNWWDEVVLNQKSQQLIPIPLIDDRYLSCARGEPVEGYVRTNGSTSSPRAQELSSLTLENELTLTFLPASHWTSRGLFDINKSLWGSWMLSANNQNVYFAGDTAYDQHFFQSIKKEFPSINAALMPIGPNEPRGLMHDAHMSSEEAVQAFLDLDAQHFFPMHWGTFMFALDGFIQPVERLVSYWGLQKKLLTNKTLHLIKCGESKQLSTNQTTVPKPTEQQIVE